jgi:hypothetical protein
MLAYFLKQTNMHTSMMCQLTQRFALKSNTPGIGRPGRYVLASYNARFIFNAPLRTPTPAVQGELGWVPFDVRAKWSATSMLIHLRVQVVTLYCTKPCVHSACY